MFTGGKFTQFKKLPVNRHDLLILNIGGFAGVEKVFCTVCFHASIIPYHHFQSR
jgi:hypothetical protein